MCYCHYYILTTTVYTESGCRPLSVWQYRCGHAGHGDGSTCRTICWYCFGNWYETTKDFSGPYVCLGAAHLKPSIRRPFLYTTNCSTWSGAGQQTHLSLTSLVMLKKQKKDLTAFTLILTEHCYPRKTHYKWACFNVLIMSNKRLPKSPYVCFMFTHCKFNRRYRYRVCIQ